MLLTGWECTTLRQVHQLTRSQREAMPWGTGQSRTPLGVRTQCKCRNTLAPGTAATKTLSIGGVSTVDRRRYENKALWYLVTFLKFILIFHLLSLITEGPLRKISGFFVVNWSAKTETTSYNMTRSKQCQNQNIKCHSSSSTAAKCFVFFFPLI